MKKYRVLVYNTQYYLPMLIYNYKPGELLKSIQTGQLPGEPTGQLRTGVFEFIISPGTWDEQMDVFTPHKLYEFRYIDPHTFKHGNVQFPFERIMKAYGKRMMLISNAEKQILDSYAI